MTALKEEVKTRSTEGKERADEMVTQVRNVVSCSPSDLYFMLAKWSRL